MPFVRLEVEGEGDVDVYAFLHNDTRNVVAKWGPLARSHAHSRSPLRTSALSLLNWGREFESEERKGVRRGE